VAKSLKEALLEQMAALQERGLAPGELPVEHEEEPSYLHYEGETERRSYGGDRDSDARRNAGGRVQRVRTRTAVVRPRDHRELKEPRGGRDRRDSRGARENQEIPPGLVGPAPTPAPRVPRPPMGQPGPRPMMGGPRPAPRSDMLRRNAERIQREQAEKNEVRQLLSQYNGAEADDAAIDTFFSQLSVETGALPPLNVVLEALKNAGNANAAEVGNQVRAYYRRPRAARTPVGVS
jgi:hypothetical protein